MKRETFTNPAIWPQPEPGWHACVSIKACESPISLDTIPEQVKGNMPPTLGPLSDSPVRGIEAFARWRVTSNAQHLRFNVDRLLTSGCRSTSNDHSLN